VELFDLPSTERLPASFSVLGKMERGVHDEALKVRRKLSNHVSQITTKHHI
jgi:hypothetical protein